MSSRGDLERQIIFWTVTPTVICFRLWRRLADRAVGLANRFRAVKLKNRRSGPIRQ